MSPGSGSKPRTIGHKNWKVTLPGGPLTLLQIVIGIIDLAFCALAMYVLVPDDPHIGFITLAVIFVSATLLGFASHSPGGIGVFDAAMLVALWQFDKEELLAGLLLFRLLYYIVPFALSLAILGIREIILGMTAPDVPHVDELVSDVLSDDQRKRGERNPQASAMAADDALSRRGGLWSAGSSPRGILALAIAAMQWDEAGVADSARRRAVPSSAAARFLHRMHPRASHTAVRRDDVARDLAQDLLDAVSRCIVRSRHRSRS